MTGAAFTSGNRPNRAYPVTCQTQLDECKQTTVTAAPSTKPQIARNAILRRGRRAHDLRRASNLTFSNFTLMPPTAPRRQILNGIPTFVRQLGGVDFSHRSTGSVYTNEPLASSPLTPESTDMKIIEQVFPDALLQRMGKQVQAASCSLQTSHMRTSPT